MSLLRQWATEDLRWVAAVCSWGRVHSKFNQCHDEETGQFCSDGGGGAPAAEPAPAPAAAPTKTKPNYGPLPRDPKADEPPQLNGEYGSPLYAPDGSLSKVGEKADRQIRQLYDGRVGLEDVVSAYSPHLPGGMSVHWLQVSGSDDTVHVSGEIVDGEGNKAGSFSRFLRPGFATHSLLIMNPEAQGHGVGGVLSLSADQFYRQAGVPGIRLDAASAPGDKITGHQMWPRQGFDWSDPAEKAGIVRAFNDAIVAKYGAGSPEAQASSKLDHAWDFVRLTDSHGDKVGRDLMNLSTLPGNHVHIAEMWRNLNDPAAEQVWHEYKQHVLEKLGKKQAGAQGKQASGEEAPDAGAADLDEMIDRLNRRFGLLVPDLGPLRDAGLGEKWRPWSEAELQVVEVRRQLQPNRPPAEFRDSFDERLDWTTEELAQVLELRVCRWGRVHAKFNECHDEETGQCCSGGLGGAPPQAPCSQPSGKLGGREKKPLSTLQLLEPMQRQITAYHGQLQRVFDKGIRELAALVDDVERHSVGAMPHATQEGQRVLGEMQAGMVALAATRYPAAFETGRAHAAQMTGGLLHEDEIRRLVNGREQQNAHFVQMSLLADVGQVFATAVQEAARGVPAKAVAVKAEPDQPHQDEADPSQQVTRLMESMAARLLMYATPLWGLMSLAFAEEMGAASMPVDWRTTSAEPCPDCDELEAGGPYDRYNPLPTTPGAGDTQCLCWLDPRTMVMTESGWRRIDAVRVGDRVLTHRGRFRRVIALPVDGQRYVGPRIDVRVSLPDAMKCGRMKPLTLTMTPSHRLRSGDQWVRADELKAAQRIALVHLLCEQCGRPMSIRGRDGQRRTCSARCRNAQRGPQTIGVARAVIEAKGWARPLRGKTWEDVYGADGAARRRANMVSQGRRRLGKSYEDLTDSVTAAEWRRKAGSTWRGKTPEELLGPERAAALREVRRQHLLARGPLAVAMSRRGEPSRLELTMRALLDRLGIRFEPQASVAGRQVDLYLPDYKLVIECDGEYWHQRPESQARDARNTAALEAAGYTVLRFGGQEIERRLDTVQARLLRVVANHEGRYVTGEVEIESVRVRIENSREASLYDLAVEEDRSYIVNGGIVSHNSNCLCLLTVLARP